MNIGLINEYFPPFAPGGAEWSVFYLARGLAQMGNRVTVITPNYGAAEEEKREGVQIYRFPFPCRLGNRRILPHGYLANPLFYLYSAFQIARFGRRAEVEVLHCQNKHSLVGTYLAGRLFLKVPVVVTLRDLLCLCRYGMCLMNYEENPHGCDLRTYLDCVREFRQRYMPPGFLSVARLLVSALVSRLDVALKKWVLNRTDRIVTISRKLGQIYASRKVGIGKMVTIYNAVDFPPSGSVGQSQDMERENRPRRVLCAGKLSWGKGSDQLLEAMPYILSRRTDVELVFVGDGPLRAYLTERAEALQIASQVILLGPLSHDALFDWYTRVDVVVVPSLVQEGFGRIALEALAHGVPAVVTNRGGLPEIVEEGRTGYIVPPEPKALAEGVLKALNNPSLAATVRESYPHLREKFGAEVYHQHMALYREVGAGR